MAGPIRLYFDVWSGTDPQGVAIGELTQAYEKRILDAQSKPGSGEFWINRHDEQAAWCRTGNLVRVRLVAGGPFAWNDSRYKFAFFIEDGQDNLLSPDEEEGEDWKRGGRGILSVLEGLIWWMTNFTGTTGVQDDGYWHWTDDQYGDILRRALLEWNARPDPKPRPPTLFYSFSATADSDGTPWPSFDGEHRIQVGQDYLAATLQLASHGLELHMDPAFSVDAWVEGGRGSDLSDTLAFRQGWNIREAGSRTIYGGRKRATRALVRDADGAFWEVVDAHTDPDEEGFLGRRETYVSTQDLGETGPVGRIGRQALKALRTQDQGPITIGVTSYGSGSDGGSPPARQDVLPYTDYDVGDEVTVDIPGEYDNAGHKRIEEIVIQEDENGEAEVSITLEGAPFDPLSSLGSDASPTGSKSGGCGCVIPTPTPVCYPAEGVEACGWYIDELGSAAADHYNPKPAYASTPAGNSDDEFLPYLHIGATSTNNLIGGCITPGLTYSGSIYMRSNSAYGIYRIKIQHNGTGGTPDQTQIAYYKPNASNVNHVIPFDTFTIPEDATFARISLGATYGGWQWKDFIITQMSAAGGDDPDCQPEDVAGVSDHWVRTDDSRLDPRDIRSSAQVIFEGGGAALSAGLQADVIMPYDAALIGVRLMADQAGDAVVDVWSDQSANYPPTDPDSITGGNEPELSSADYYEDDVLDSWTTDLSAGDTLRINLDSVTTIERLTVALMFSRLV